MDATLHALVDPRRRQIIELLRDRDRPVAELTERLPIAQSGVSRHLRILREAGIVTVKAQGQRRIYALRPEPFDALSDWLRELRAVWTARLDKLEAELARRQASHDRRES